MKILRIFCVGLISIVLVFGSFWVYVFSSYKMDYIPEKRCEQLESWFDMDFSKVNSMTQEEIRAEVSSWFGNPRYTYKEVETLPNNYSGMCYFFVDIIFMKKGLSNDYYMRTFTHELVHLTYSTDSERFCEYKAFTMLYENGYMEVALKHGYLNYRSSKPYKATHYINEYLEGKNGKVE